MQLLLTNMQEARKRQANDLAIKSKRALKAIISKCAKIEALDALLMNKDAPIKISKHVLMRFKDLLPNDVQARRNFVASGGLQYIQQLREQEEDEVGSLV